MILWTEHYYYKAQGLATDRAECHCRHWEGLSMIGNDFYIEAEAPADLA